MWEVSQTGVPQIPRPRPILVFHGRFHHRLSHTNLAISSAVIPAVHVSPFRFDFEEASRSNRLRVRPLLPGVLKFVTTFEFHGN